MARGQGFTVQNKPIKGLITEQTALSFGDDACTKIVDCVLDDKGRVSRRKGWQRENGGANAVITSQAGTTSYSEYVWDNPGGDTTKRFVVQQIGYLVYFYDASTVDTVVTGTSQLAEILDLRNYLAPFTEVTDNPGDYISQFADGNKDLFVTNPVCDPVAVTYNTLTGALEFNEIILEARDFEGLEDGVADTTRPTATVAGIKVSNPNFFYNIVNNGWGQTDALTQWDAARTDLPSKADYPGFYRSSATDSFDPAQVTAKSPGTRLGKGGHFILRVNDPNRTQALIDDGHTGVTILDPLDAPLPTGTGTPFGDADAGNPSSNAFDNNTLTSAIKSTFTAYMGVGLDLSATPVKVLKVQIKPRKHSNGVNHFFSGTGTSVNCTIEIYGHTAAANGTFDNGTLLGSVDFTQPAFTIDPEGYTIISSDNTTEFDYVWAKIRRQDGVTTDTWHISEVIIYDNDEQVKADRRVTAVAFYAGRIWYGIDNKLMFTQIIENKNQYGRAYQVNDPTNEELSDLLASDGGVVSILNMAEVVKIVPAFGALIIIASNGIWQIGGSGGAQFKADDYSIDQLSTIGADAPSSVNLVNGVPIWWGYEGIQTVQYSPQYGKFTVSSLTEETINSVILAVPAANRPKIKAAYDFRARVAYWLYANDGTEYDTILCMSSKTGSFFLWTIPTTVNKIVGLTSLKNPKEDGREIIKYTTISDIDTITYNLFYSEPINTAYLDWTIGNYQSEMITGYKIDGQGIKDFQCNYGIFFFENTPGGSCKMQCVYDFTENGNTGRWSVSQQCYNAGTAGKVRMRKLKLRGRGKAIQFRFTSETGKPFTLLGWSCFETANQEV